MTAPTVEKPPENLAADEWYAAEEPDPADEGAGPEAPYGWMTDPETGEQRPKKTPGRPRKPPTAEELAGAPPLQREPDVPPKPPGRKRAKPKAGQPAEPDMPDAGFIAAGVNRLYRRAGKVVRAVMDEDIGEAIIYCTHPDDPDDISVGQAWEQLCKVNPRVRRFVLNAISGGAWSDLVLAHAPIGLALFMKPAVQRFLPWARVVEAVAEPDAETPGDVGGLGGMTADDVGEVSDLVSAQARQMAERAARAAGIEVSDEQMAEAVARAEAMMAGGGLPAGLRRQQPKRTTRAQRTGR